VTNLAIDSVSLNIRYKCADNGVLGTYTTYSPDVRDQLHDATHLFYMSGITNEDAL
jgi:hypothetical protein